MAVALGYNITNIDRKNAHEVRVLNHIHSYQTSLMGVILHRSADLSGRGFSPRRYTRAWAFQFPIVPAKNYDWFVG